MQPFRASVSELMQAAEGVVGVCPFMAEPKSSEHTRLGQMYIFRGTWPNEALFPGKEMLLSLCPQLHDGWRARNPEKTERRPWWITATCWSACRPTSPAAKNSPTFSRFALRMKTHRRQTCAFHKHTKISLFL